MELRHLRYFVVVGETLSFNKAAAKLRIAQPALSRQVQDLEDEIGVDLFSRSPRGVTLTAEGKLFLEEARAILQRTEEATTKTRALARGEYGELHIGYSPTPTSEILPPALAAFQKATPGVKIVLHDLAGDELNAGLLDGSLHLAVMVERADEGSLGLKFEELRRYRFCVAAAPDHRFAKLKSIPVAQAAVEPLIAFRRKDYSGYYGILDKIFSPHDLHPRVVVECDGSRSLITEVEIGRGIAIVSEVYRQISGKRLVYRQFSDSDEAYGIGIMTALKGDTTPAGEKFCEMLRKVASR
jgi:DNA-binding transcriptional LysR family regulator